MRVRSVRASSLGPRVGPSSKHFEGTGRRGYPFPILGDRGARLADALGAEYASYAVVFDSRGHVRYRGGIDTDRSHLHDGATPYLQDALEDLLAAHEPRFPEGKTLGCSLQKW